MLFLLERLLHRLNCERECQCDTHRSEIGFRIKTRETDGENKIRNRKQQVIREQETAGRQMRPDRNTRFAATGIKGKRSAQPVVTHWPGAALRVKRTGADLPERIRRRTCCEIVSCVLSDSSDSIF